MHPHLLYSTHVCTSHTLISFRSVLTVITKFDSSLNRFTTSKFHASSAVSATSAAGDGTSGIRVGNGGASIRARYRSTAGGYNAICEYSWLPLCIKAGVTVDRKSLRKTASGSWTSCAESSSSNYNIIHICTQTARTYTYKLHADPTRGGLYWHIPGVPTRCSVCPAPSPGCRNYLWSSPPGPSDECTRPVFCVLASSSRSIRPTRSSVADILYTGDRITRRF